MQNNPLDQKGIRYINKACIVNLTKVDYPYVSNTMILFFCGYVLTWYLQIGYRLPALGAIRFEFVYAAVLSLLAVVATPRIDFKCPLLPYVMSYFAVIFVQVLFSQDFATSWVVFVDRIVKFAFMTFFIISFVRSPSHLKLFLGAFLLACLKMGQEGLVGRLTGGLIWENQGIMRLHGATPMYQHPNSYTGMALGTLPFVYFLWPICHRYLKVVLLILGALSLHIVVYTGSRTGYLGAIVFLFFAFSMSKRKKVFITCLLTLGILFMPLIPSDYHERFQSIFTQEEKEGRSTEARLEILKDAWEIFTDNPLGVGVAAFPKVRMERFGRLQDTHNLYLEIATNLGVQGLLVVGLLICKLFKILNYIRNNAKLYINILHQNGNANDNKLLIDLEIIEAVALATTGFIVVRLTLGMFGMDLYEIYWWFAIGVTFSLYSMLANIEGSLIANHNNVVE